MTLYRLPAGAVLLADEDAAAALYAVEAAQRSRQRNGLPPLLSLTRLHAALAPPGHGASPTEPVGEPELVTTREAAELLRVSVRTVRRLAPGLGGRIVGGRLLLDRQAINEHTQGVTAQTGT